MPLVSVIMNCFNSDRYLQEAIDSVFAQTFKDWEIIFWDNQSTDRSAEIALSYGESLQYFKGEEFLSLGAARNKAIEKARGKYIAFLDCDDIWVPEKLESQVNIFESNQDVDFLYSNFYTLDSSTKQLLITFRSRQPTGCVFKHFLHNYPVGILTVMVRKAALDRLDNLFDAKLGLAEEYDVFMRLLYRSKSHYIEEPLAIYRIHADMASIKKGEKWAEEITYVLDKLKSLEVSVTDLFKKDLLYAEANAQYTQASIWITRGDRYRARELISQHKLVGLKFYILYIGTFLPIGWWLGIRSFWHSRGKQ